MAISLKYGLIFTADDVRAIFKVAGLEDADVEVLWAEAIAQGYRPHFGVDEPVVPFRAQDEYLVNVLEYYENLCTNSSPPKHVRGLQAARARVEEWQETHETKIPSSDGYMPPELDEI